MLTGNKILVTGASGFVGNSIVGELNSAGRYEVYGLFGKRGNFQTNGQIPRSNILQADISDYQTLKNREILQDTSVLIHSAGLAHQFGNVRKENFWDINVRGTENVCRLAREIGVEHFILISSVSVYGDHENAEIDETFACKPSGFYGESKFEAEQRALEICGQNKIGLTILRLAAVIGEGDRGNTARLITAIDKGRFLWVGSGSNKKSLIYKTDAAKGVLKIVQAKLNNEAEIFNLTGKAVSMKEIVETISNSLCKKYTGLKISEELIRGIFKLNSKAFSIEYIKKFEKTFEKWLSDDIFSGEKLSEKYNFRPQTAISEGLAKQVNYYLRQKIKR